jgi:hypothetical protein
VKRTGLRRPALFTPLTGVVCGLISAFDALLKPIQYFLFDPTHPALAELDPFREPSGRFKAGYMLRGIKDHLLELTL